MRNRGVFGKKPGLVEGLLFHCTVFGGWRMESMGITGGWRCQFSENGSNEGMINFFMRRVGIICLHS